MKRSDVTRTRKFHQVKPRRSLQVARLHIVLPENGTNRITESNTSMHFIFPNVTTGVQQTDKCFNHMTQQQSPEGQHRRVIYEEWLLG